MKLNPLWMASFGVPSTPQNTLWPPKPERPVVEHNVLWRNSRYTTEETEHSTPDRLSNCFARLGGKGFGIACLDYLFDLFRTMFAGAFIGAPIQ